MIRYFKTIEGVVRQIEGLDDGCWVSVESPTPGDLAYLREEMKLEPDFISAALDDEESSRIEAHDGQTLVIVDLPTIAATDDGTVVFSTIPIGIVLLENWIVTICLRPQPLITEAASGEVRGVTTHLRTRFLLQLLLRIASRFLSYLKQIDKISSQTESQLHRSMKNSELIQLLGLEKSLVYFSTSLKSNEMTLEKILRGRIIKLYDEDQELLEDVLIEVKQAIEMCSIYSSILSGTMDAFASIISNNLNIVMKVLTSLTIVMAIPTMVSGFYGMNVSGIPLPSFWFPATLSVVLVLICAGILMKKGLFK